jgi:hypothetical protein
MVAAGQSKATLSPWTYVLQASTLIALVVGIATLLNLSIKIGEFKAQVVQNTQAHQANFRRIENVTDAITKLGIAVASLSAADEANRAHVMAQIMDVRDRLRQLEAGRPLLQGQPRTQP